MKRTFPLFSHFLVTAMLACLSACSPGEPEAAAAGGGGETGPEAVDLGLSVRWASCNMGASGPHEAGGLYGWADPTGQATTAQVHDSAGNWTSELYGGADPLPDICRTVYDMPHAQLGGYWRLPSENEAEELLERCTWRRETLQGVTGYRVTGPNGNSIFLPMAGMRMENEHYMQGQRGYYWTGTRQLDGTGATSLWVGTGGKGQVSHDYRYQGCSIRPVSGTDSATIRYDSPLDTVDRRVDMGILSDGGRPLYWASGNLVVRRYARSYIAHEPTFVPEQRVFSQTALEWDLFAWGDATGRIQYYSDEWEALNVDALPDDISGDGRYDVARAQLGGNWRLPTESEWWRLIDNCEMTYDTLLGHHRVWLTSRINGEVLCLDNSKSFRLMSTDRPEFEEADSEFLCSERDERMHLDIRWFIDMSDMHTFQMPTISIYKANEGMHLVRPVTE